MDRMKNLLGGPGFYAALALCVLAVGAGGFFLLRREEPVEPERPQVQTAAPAEETPEHEPVMETVPLEEPEEEAAEDDPVPVTAMPETEVDDTPVTAEPPLAPVSPLEGEVAAAFSVETLMYDETMDDWRTHDGVDIAAAEGDTVLAALAGTVASVTDDGLMGTTVVLRHSGGYETTYAGLRAQPPVEAGDAVSAGQAIGAVGAAAPAEATLGPHLHFSVTRDGAAVDPAAFLEP